MPAGWTGHNSCHRFRPACIHRTSPSVEETEMRRLLSIKLLALSCLLAACVTVNVYFPAAAAEQAADRIIDTVTSQQKSNETTAPAKTPPNSRMAPASGQPLLAASHYRIDQPVPSATSAQADRPLLLAAA